MKQPCLWLVSGLTLLAFFTVRFATTPTFSTITVTGDIIRKAADFQPLGVNNFGDVGGTKHSYGNLITQSGFEPITMRDLYRVIESGEENGKHWVTLDGAGTSKDQLYTTGTYSGAAMRAYRFVDSKGHTLSYKKADRAAGGKILDAENATQCLPLFTTRVLAKGDSGFPNGGWLAPDVPDRHQEWKDMSKEKQNEIRKRWRVYYEADKPLIMDDIVIFTRSFSWPETGDFHPRVTEKGIQSNWNDVIGSSQFIPTPEDTPADVNADQGVLEITSDGGVAQVWHKLFGATGRKDALWYGTLEEGLVYRYEAWVKEVHSTNGRIRFGLGGNHPTSLNKGYFGDVSVNKSFPAPSEWQRVGYTFRAPATPDKGGIEGAIIRYEGDGKLLVDNVKLQPVYGPGDEEKPFVINRRLFKTLLESQPASGRKGAVRFWTGLSSDPMKQLLGWTGASHVKLTNHIQVNSNKNQSIPKSLIIVEATGQSPQTRMVPWLITQITHTEEEYLQLVEYLAAPYDAATDTPESKPFAYKRTQQRGDNQPWTDTFREIIIEFGNENWHNRAMPGWIGMGRKGMVHHGGVEFGLWGRYMINIMRHSPYWNDSISISFGGNYSAAIRPDGSVKGYGQEATIAAQGGNNYVGHATYIGPRWELGESSQTTIDESGVQKTLFSYRPATAASWSKMQATHDRLHEMGLKTQAVAYEGGPSGFGFRAKSPEEDRAGEYYGKSYAMGTAILDSWIDAWAKGWTYQCYLSFGQGRWWASHTSLSQGHRASPGWLTQVMVNRTLANLDLITATLEDAPTLPVSLPVRGKKYGWWEIIPTQDTPSLYAHAFSGPGVIAVAVVNLDLKNSATIKVNLPIKTAKSITRHYLSGDPRDTNLDELKVELKSGELAADQLRNGVFNGEIPVGSGVVIVFKH